MTNLERLENLRKLREEMFSLDPTSQEFNEKFVDRSTSDLYRSLGTDEFDDVLQGFRSENLGEVNNELDDSGILDSGTGLDDVVRSENSDTSFLDDFVNDQEGNFLNNSVNAFNSVLSAQSTEVDSDLGTISQTASLGLSGAKLGASLGPIGAVVGGLGGAAYGLFDGLSDRKKIEKRKKNQYRKAIDDVKKSRKQDYLASGGGKNLNI